MPADERESARTATDPCLPMSHPYVGWHGLPSPSSPFAPCRQRRRWCSSPAIAALPLAFLGSRITSGRRRSRKPPPPATCRNRPGAIPALINEFAANSPDWLFETDAELRIVHASAQLEHFTGADPVGAPLDSAAARSRNPAADGSRCCGWRSACRSTASRSRPALAGCSVTGRSPAGRYSTRPVVSPAIAASGTTSRPITGQRNTPARQGGGGTGRARPNRIS